MIIPRIRKAAFGMFLMGGLLLPRAAHAIIDGLTLSNGGMLSLTNHAVFITTGNFVLAGGNLTMDAALSPGIVVGGSWTYTSGTFIVGNGTVSFNASATGMTIWNSETPFYNVNFGGKGGGYYTLLESMTVTNTLNIGAGQSLDIAGLLVGAGGGVTNSGNLVIRGTETLAWTPTNQPGSTVTYNALSGSPVVWSTWTYSNLSVNGSGLTFNLLGQLTTTGNGGVAIGTSTTLDVTTNDYPITIGGNLTKYTNGLLNIRTSTITLIGTGATPQSINNIGTTFYLIVDSNTSSGGVLFASSFTATTLTIDGLDLGAVGPPTVFFNANSTFTIATMSALGNSSGYPVVLKSWTSGTNWELQITGTITASTVTVKDSDARQSPTITPAFTSTDSGNNKNWNFGAASLSPKRWTGGYSSVWTNGQNWDNGVPNSLDTVVINASATIMPALSSNQTLYSLTIGTYPAALYLKGYDLTVTNYFQNQGNLTLYGYESLSIPTPSNFGTTGSTVTYDTDRLSNNWVIMSTLTYNNLIISTNSFNSAVFTIAGSSPLVVQGNFQILAGTVTTAPNNNYISIGGSVTVSGGTASAGNSGAALVLNTSTMTVGGSWTFATGAGGIATFGTANSTVTFTDTTPSVLTLTANAYAYTNIIVAGSGANNNLSLAGYPLTVSTLTINSGSTFTITGITPLNVSSFTNAGTFNFNGTETVTSTPTFVVGSTVIYRSAGAAPMLSTWTYRNLQIYRRRYLQLWREAP
jgi:hypothetical protein